MKYPKIYDQKKREKVYKGRLRISIYKIINFLRLEGRYTSSYTNLNAQNNII